MISWNAGGRKRGRRLAAGAPPRTSKRHRRCAQTEAPQQAGPSLLPEAVLAAALWTTTPSKNPSRSGDVVRLTSTPVRTPAAPAFSAAGGPQYRPRPRQQDEDPHSHAFLFGSADGGGVAFPEFGAPAAPAPVPAGSEGGPGAGPRPWFQHQQHQQHQHQQYQYQQQYQQQPPALAPVRYWDDGKEIPPW